MVITASYCVQERNGNKVKLEDIVVMKIKSRPELFHSMTQVP